MAQKTSWIGASLTESDINTYLMHEGGAWSSWTPVVTQSNTPTLTNTRSRYGRAGRLIYGTAQIVMTGSGTATNNVIISVPVAMGSSTPNLIIGQGMIYDASAGFFYYGLLVRNTSTTVAFQRTLEGAAQTLLGTAGFTAALANTDQIHISFFYEAAS